VPRLRPWLPPAIRGPGERYSPRAMSYRPLRDAVSHFTPLRGLRYHAHHWGDASLASAEQPPLVLLHGWMDVGASYQFFVDALAAAEGAKRWVIAPDWRGFGLTDTPAADCYWFPDYLADLDALLDAVLPAERFGAIDLVGHSMGGNVAMVYAGVRPARVRRLINLEGFGMPRTTAEQAPGRLVQWLDELKRPERLRDYASLAEVAERLIANNPLLSRDKADWLAPHWAEERADGRWHIRGDPAHKRTNPILYDALGTLEAWRRITAPLLWADGDRTDVAKWWGKRYPREEFEARLAVVSSALRKVRLAPCGHMLHHDQPEALAAEVLAFLQAA
jgi:pimeloyl-ACP methyl ester carboxylesterase